MTLRTNPGVRKERLKKNDFADMDINRSWRVSNETKEMVANEVLWYVRVFSLSYLVDLWASMGYNHLVIIAVAPQAGILK
jgi:hypothetical protein